MPADLFIQWKGTDLCADFYCYTCGQQGHFDGMFAYHLQCANCQQVYELPSNFGLKPVSITADAGCIQLVEVMRDAYLKDTGPVPEGQCEY